MNDMKKRLYEKQADENKEAVKRASFWRSIPWYAWFLFALCVLNSCSTNDAMNRIRRLENAMEAMSGYRGLFK